ncbi:phasin family protein [Niveispirillum irakense]|uniref:phasin family protein n=1 Tax=Niveispirillum irakense TaxID=34011 RepID=UPI00041134AA|nr:phasin family protein [Niveispirillum irakense]
MTSTIKNPFLDFDPTKFWDMSRFTDMQKMFGDMKLPTGDFDSVLASQRRNVEAVVAANQLALEGAQAVARRHAEIVRQTIEETSSVVTQLITPGTPEDKVAKQAELIKSAFEHASANMKELGEMIAKSNTEAVEVLTKRLQENFDEVQTMLGKLTPKKG